MKDTPPPALVETWIHLIAYGNENIDQHKFEIRKALKEHFGTLDLAKAYVKESKKSDEKIYYV